MLINFASIDLNEFFLFDKIIRKGGEWLFYWSNEKNFQLEHFARTQLASIELTWFLKLIFFNKECCCWCLKKNSIFLILLASLSFFSVCVCVCGSFFFYFEGNAQLNFREREKEKSEIIIDLLISGSINLKLN